MSSPEVNTSKKEKSDFLLKVAIVVIPFCWMIIRYVDRIYTDDRYTNFWIFMAILVVLVPALFIVAVRLYDLTVQLIYRIGILFGFIKSTRSPATISSAQSSNTTLTQTPKAIRTPVRLATSRGLSAYTGQPTPGLLSTSKSLVDSTTSFSVNGLGSSTRVGFSSRSRRPSTSGLRTMSFENTIDDLTSQIPESISTPHRLGSTVGGTRGDQSVSKILLDTLNTPTATRALELTPARFNTPRPPPYSTTKTMSISNVIAPTPMSMHKLDRYMHSLPSSGIEGSLNPLDSRYENLNTLGTAGTPSSKADNSLGLVVQSKGLSFGAGSTFSLKNSKVLHTMSTQFPSSNISSSTVSTSSKIPVQLPAPQVAAHRLRDAIAAHIANVFLPIYHANAIELSKVDFGGYKVPVSVFMRGDFGGDRHGFSGMDGVVDIKDKNELLSKFPMSYISLPNANDIVNPTTTVSSAPAAPSSGLYGSSIGSGFGSNFSSFSVPVANAPTISNVTSNVNNASIAAKPMKPRTLDEIILNYSRVKTSKFNSATGRRLKIGTQGFPLVISPSPNTLAQDLLAGSPHKSLETYLSTRLNLNSNGNASGNSVLQDMINDGWVLRTSSRVNLFAEKLQLEKYLLPPRFQNSNLIALSSSAQPARIDVKSYVLHRLSEMVRIPSWSGCHKPGSDAPALRFSNFASESVLNLSNGSGNNSNNAPDFVPSDAEIIFWYFIKMMDDVILEAANDASIIVPSLQEPKSSANPTENTEVSSTVPAISTGVSASLNANIQGPFERLYVHLQNTSNSGNVIGAFSSLLSPSFAFSQLSGISNSKGNTLNNLFVMPGTNAAVYHPSLRFILQLNSPDFWDGAQLLVDGKDIAVGPTDLSPKNISPDRICAVIGLFSHLLLFEADGEVAVSPEAAVKIPAILNVLTGSY